MIPKIGVRIAPKSGQKPGKSLFFHGPVPKLTHFLESARSPCSSFFKKCRFFQVRKKGSKMVQKWVIFAVFAVFCKGQKSIKHRKKGHFSGFVKKVSKSAKIGDFGGRPVDPQKKSRKIGLFGRSHFLSKKLERVLSKKWKFKQSHCR